jgi:hypothetical protein
MRHIKIIDIIIVIISLGVGLLLILNMLSYTKSPYNDIGIINKIVSLCKVKALQSNNKVFYGIMLEDHNIYIIKSYNLKDYEIEQKIPLKNIVIEVNNTDKYIYYNSNGMSINTEHLLFKIKNKDNKVIKQGIIHCTGVVNIWDVS